MSLLRFRAGRALIREAPKQAAHSRNAIAMHIKDRFVDNKRRKKTAATSCRKVQNQSLSLERVKVAAHEDQKSLLKNRYPCRARKGGGGIGGSQTSQPHQQ